MMEARNWTPKQISEEISIPQLVGLFFADEADGWATVGREGALAWARKKEAEKEARIAGTG